MMPLVVWRLSDGKAGHDSQSWGLAEALSRLRPVETVTLYPLSASGALAVLLLGQPPVAWQSLPPPDLLVGAGHCTHLSLLAARRVQGGKAVVLMRPSLPLGLFDLCVIPEHDSPPIRPNVLVTRGALNRIQPSATLESNQGLLLIGGPSAHFGWDDADLHQQIAAVLAATPRIQWTLTTSRRTPATFLTRLMAESDGALTIVPFAATSPDWLPTQLARADQAWVTADSVSMVYEALTAGAAVGVLDVPRPHPSRISRGLEKLMAQGWITPFAEWRQKPRLHRPPRQFNEAERCAHWIVERWYV
jgi:mitochondrial fission protein ELM1